MDDGPPGFNRNSSCSGLLGRYVDRDFVFDYGTFTLCGPLSQHGSSNDIFCNCRRGLQTTNTYSHNPQQATIAVLHSPGLGFSPFAHHYSGYLSRFLFLRLLRCFTSPGSFPYGMTEGCSAGLPHSEIHGSKDACSSPWLFAACHVFLRLQVPRHPPYALITLTSLCFLYSVVKELAKNGESRSTLPTLAW